MVSLLLLCVLVSSCLVYTAICCSTCDACVTALHTAISTGSCITFLETLKFDSTDKCPAEDLSSTVACINGLATARENVATYCIDDKLIDALPVSVLAEEIEDLESNA